MKVGFKLVKHVSKEVVEARERKCSRKVKSVNKTIEKLPNRFRSKVDNGYHSFEKLYNHRTLLFAFICNQNKDNCWKTWKHDDYSVSIDFFIAGIETPEGIFSYHCHKDYWDLFEVEEIEKVKYWDGHSSKDIDRLFSLIGKQEEVKDLK